MQVMEGFIVSEMLAGVGGDGGRGGFDSDAGMTNAALLHGSTAELCQAASLLLQFCYSIAEMLL